MIKKKLQKYLKEVKIKFADLFKLTRDIKSKVEKLDTQKWKEVNEKISLTMYI